MLTITVASSTLNAVVGTPAQLNAVLRSAVLDATVGQRFTLALNIGARGPKGDKGDTGPEGPQPPTYTHYQGVASAVWTINHDMNRRPSVVIEDSLGDDCDGAITYVDANTVVLTFSAAISGTAYLN